MSMSRRRAAPPERQRPLAEEEAIALAPDQTSQPSEAARPWYGRPLEYGLLAAAAILMAAFALIFFFFGLDLAQLTTYGYLGLFVISLISAASIVMPMPGAAAVTSAGAFLDPVLSIPVPILVGLVAGPAETLGELTGYAAGYGGSALFRDRSFYPRVRGWMERRGIVTMFVLSSFPNPLVDVAGVAAGAVRMRLWRFVVGVLAGKVFKNIYLASGGLAGAELIRRFFG